ncbi:MAG: MFS transporter [Candidatus Thermoplasmatota archaeon]
MHTGRDLRNFLSYLNVPRDILDSLGHFAHQSRSAKLLVLVTFLSGFGGTLAGFILVLHIERLGYGTETFGTLMLLSGMVTIATLIFSGVLSDALGRKRMMACGLLLSTLGTLCFSMRTALPWLFAATAMGGVAGGLIGPSSSALLSELGSNKERKFLFSYAAFVGTVGGAGATMLAGMIPGAFISMAGFSVVQGYQMVFLFAFAFQISALVALGFVRSGTQPNHGDGKDAQKTVRRLIMKFSLPMAVIGFGAGFVIPYFQVFFELRFHAPVELIGAAFMIEHLVMALALLWIPRAAERFGSMRAIIGTQGTAVLLLVLIPVIPPPYFWLVVALFVARMVLMNVSAPILSSFMMGCIPEENRATATSATMFAWIASNSIGIFLAGPIWAGASHYLPFTICIVLYVLGLSLYTLFFWGVDDAP